MKEPTARAQSDRQTLRIFTDIARAHRRELLTSALFPVGGILLTVLAPLFIGKALGALTQPASQPQSYLLAFILAAALGILANRIGHPAMVLHQALMMRDAQELALSTLLRRSVGFHNDNVGGKLVSDALDYSTAISQLHNTIVSSLLPFLLTLLFGSIVIFGASWPLGLFIMAMTGVILGLGIYDSRRMQPRRTLRQNANKAVTAHLADTITNVQTVKTFGREEQELHEHRRLAHTLYDIRAADWRLMSLRGNNRIALVAAFQAIFVLVTITLVRADPNLLGIGIFAFTFTLTLSSRLFEVNLMIRNIEDGLMQAAPMTRIILENPEIRDAPGARALRIGGGEITFNHVTFRYPDAGTGDNVFSNLNLAIASGEKIGLVGPSGGGKSTFTRLLLRFDDITQGSISIDRQDISAVTQHSLREGIAYVPQEPLLFHRSIDDNIRYGKFGASQHDIERAAHLANADTFIDKLPEGYNTIVGERGVKLSGGQRQRIAIARAILKNAPILILDEATAALDSESEALIQDALWKLMDGRTAIVVAHRLSTIQKMDRIIVLDNGTITEQGSHKELLAQGGQYASLWARQSGGFLES